jgi:hypothetical protein
MLRVVVEMYVFWLLRNARSVPKVGVPKKVEVATAAGTAEPLVLLASTEFAAIGERPIVAFDPPISAPAPAERVMPLLLVSVVVATEATPEPLVVLYSTWPCVRFDVVASPV